MLPCVFDSKTRAHVCVCVCVYVCVCVRAREREREREGVGRGDLVTFLFSCPSLSFFVPLQVSFSSRLKRLKVT
jgi:hypothetical protein